MRANLFSLEEIRSMCKTNEEKAKFTGIENAGTQCFAISVMQLLFSINDFVADVNTGIAEPFMKLHQAMCKVRKKMSVFVHILIDEWYEFKYTFKGLCSVFEYLYYINLWYNDLKCLKFKYKIRQSVDGGDIQPQEALEDYIILLKLTAGSIQEMLDKHMEEEKEIIQIK